MAAKGRTNIFKEKLILQEEEKSLKKMLDKFQDQLNRLKIEELALVHLLRMQKSKESEQNTEPSHSHATDLGQTSANRHTVGPANPSSSLAEEDIFIESEDDEEDSLADMLPIGYLQQPVGRTGKKERASDINRETLDLGVSHGAGVFHEDVEEEEEDDSDDMEARNAAAEDESLQNDLRSFMDGF